MKLVEGVRLQPLAHDLFSAADLGLLRFTREGQERVFALVVNSARVGDFRFTKLACAEPSRGTVSGTSHIDLERE